MFIIGINSKIIKEKYFIEVTIRYEMSIITVRGNVIYNSDNGFSLYLDENYISHFDRKTCIIIDNEGLLQ